MRNDIIVEKLLAYTNKILAYCKNVDEEAFTADSKLVDACVFNLSQMGELANRVDSAFAQAHPEVPWRLLYGLRNRIVHDYEGVNLRLIWEIIHEDLLPLRDALNKTK
jgi:uncharacterized protein with HEPN domain